MIQYIYLISVEGFGQIQLFFFLIAIYINNASLPYHCPQKRVRAEEEEEDEFAAPAAKAPRPRWEGRTFR